MNKNNFLNNIAVYKTQVALVGILLMLLGFLIGRAYLSIGMMITGGIALIGVHPKEWFKARWWVMGMLWLGWLALSWFWTENKDAYSVTMQVKLPIMLLPLAFYLLPKFSIPQLRIFTAAFLLMLLGGVAWSLQAFIANPAEMIESYRYSKTIPTPAYDDHIRFSLCVALSIIWSIGSYKIWRTNIARVLVIIALALLAIYLHILAAKTGLLALYLFVLGWGIYYALKRSWKIGLLIIAGLIGGGWLAVKYVPTLSMKVGYVMYSIKMYNEGEASGKYSDIGRLISYDVALKMIADQPLTGAGAGDVLDKMKEGYAQYYPQVIEENMLYPHNQFLIEALAGGLPALLLFVLWVLMPLFVHRQQRGQRFYLYITWLVLVILLLIEPALEVQMGVFVYLFFLLWQMYNHGQEGIKTDKHKNTPKDDEFHTRISA